MTRQALFARALPGAHFLDPENTDGLATFMRVQGWLDEGETFLEAVRAGEGNMNCVVRVRTDRRSVILKQSRPWVEKYPQIAAPAERVLVEGAFYELVAPHTPVAFTMPALLGFSRESLMLMFEDLGSATDYTLMYEGRAIDRADLDRLLGYLSALHSEFTNCTCKSDFANLAMRALNHQHVFRIPLQLNDLELDGITPGLQVLADGLKADVPYINEVTRLGDRYLAGGRALLHGDYFPGSWLKAGDDVRVIDPEFCFFGPPEFDVGVMTAHLVLAKQADATVRYVFSAYQADEAFDHTLATRFAGVEIMRRLIGVAQLPLVATRDDKRRWLERSRALILGRDAL